MAKIRVLIVDDAVVVRRLVSDCLAGDPELEVVGTASNGRICLAKIPQVNPDLVTLDVEMPEMDGLETLAALRKQYPRLPVIMFSTMTQRGGAATLDALALGANDYVTKPANVGSAQAALQRVRDDLIPKIKALCGRYTPAPTPAPAPRSPLPAPPRSLASSSAAGPGPRVEAVVIGVSTGGPNALAVLIPALPADFPAPVLIVQHMPPLFTRLLAERLAAQSKLAVLEAAAGDELRPGHVYVAPGDHHLTVERRGGEPRAALNQGPPENSCRPAVDVLFRSAAEVFGAGTLAVVLTGMGQDGLRGCEKVREAGGQILVQDEASSVVWGMPGFVARAGLADRVLPLSQVSFEVVRKARRHCVPAGAAPNHSPENSALKGGSPWR